MQYVRVPKSVTIDDLRNKGHCFAPSKYSAFYPEDGSGYDFLSNLIELRSTRVKIQKKQKYIYIEIGDIDVETGIIEYKENFGAYLPGNNPLKVAKDDILVSTVRTYRKGIGYVLPDAHNMTATSAFMVISGIKKGLTKEYLFAMLRSDFFVEQILSFQNRGMYPRLDRETIDYVHIPLPRNQEELQYITIIQKALLNKEEEIRRKDALINGIIDDEILNNQNEIEFRYELPTYSEIANRGRLDTGIYSLEHKAQDFLIQNYKYGSATLKQLGFKTKKGPNLAVSVIGESIYSEKFYPNFYKLILSKNVNNYGGIRKLLYLGNKRKLPTLNKFDFLLFARGDIGKVLLIDEHLVGSTSNFDVFFISSDAAIWKKVSALCFLRYLRQKNFWEQFAIQGSAAASLTDYHLKGLRIPNFPEAKQKEITSLYYNNIPKDDLTNASTENFLELDNEWNKSAGIAQLNEATLLMKERLESIIHLLISNDAIVIDFKFLDNRF